MLVPLAHRSKPLVKAMIQSCCHVCCAGTDPFPLPAEPTGFSSVYISWCSVNIPQQACTPCAVVSKGKPRNHSQKRDKGQATAVWWLFTVCEKSRAEHIGTMNTDYPSFRIWAIAKWQSSCLTSLGSFPAPQKKNQTKQLSFSSY